MSVSRQGGELDSLVVALVAALDEVVPGIVFAEPPTLSVALDWDGEMPALQLSAYAVALIARVGAELEFDLYPPD
jgi:hypothetical protein